MSYDYEREARHRQMIEKAQWGAPKFQPRKPTDFERISNRLSFYEAAGSPELMTELSDERICFRCGHSWERHAQNEDGQLRYPQCTVWIYGSPQHFRCGCERRKTNG